MTAFLPQHEPQHSKSSRLNNLIDNQQRYQYDYTHISPLALLKDLPIRDEFAFEWMAEVALRCLDVTANRIELDTLPSGKAHHEKKHSFLKDLLALGTNSVAHIKDFVLQELRFEGRHTATAQTAQTLVEYADLFRKVGLPPIAKDFSEDRSFAGMRLAGPNPVMLQRMSSLDDRLPVTDAMIRIASPGDSLDAALAEGRLFLADYKLLDGAELGTFPNGQKYLYAPLAMFVVTGTPKELRPVAIQCRQKPAPDNPIFTPNDGFNWLIAKTIVETADGNIHEAMTHLGRTHLIMEPFVMATFRQLADNHPLSILLSAHFEGTLGINRLAWRFLIADGGGVDKLMGGTIKTSRGVAAQGVHSTNVMNDLLPLTFERRGVHDHETLPNYPYRDDSLLYWAAIQEWVENYLRLYYASDTDVQEDIELQLWAAEIGSENGGRLRGMPNDGKIHRVEELVQVTTFVIYTCSVQHAAVNFPQYDCMSFVPYMPLANYRPAPTSKTGATEADYIAMLPTLDMAELQLELGYILGTVHYTRLGQYGRHQFRDPRTSAALERFRSQLDEIDSVIEQRNLFRRPYTTLLPEGIPQSINI